MTGAKHRLLITGASGQLGSYLLRMLRRRDQSAIVWSMRPNVELSGFRCQSVDLRETAAVISAFREARPEIVIHAAALSSVADCHRDPTRARQINTTATRLLAELAERRNARLVYVSTDLVFDGKKGSYRETDCPMPLSVYGQTKVAAEREVVRYARHLVLRSSLLFGPSLNGRPSFFDQQLQAIRSGSPCTLFDDEWRTPLALSTAAEGLLAAAMSHHTGLLHLAGPERMSRLEMGRRLARALGQTNAVIIAASREDFQAAEPRPRDTSLCCERWLQYFPDIPRPTFEEAIRRLVIADTSGNMPKW